MQIDFWRALAVSHPVASSLIFVAGYAAAVAVLLPTLPLNVASGALWGPWMGSLLAIAGSSLGAILAFCVSRAALGQPLARKWDSSLIDWLRQSVDRHGWLAVAFVRLNPIFPGPVNFLFGLTSLRFSVYSVATVIFLTPPTVVFSVLGSYAGDIASGGYAGQLGRMIFISGACILFLFLSGFLLNQLRHRLNAGPSAARGPLSPAEPSHRS